MKKRSKPVPTTRKKFTALMLALLVVLGGCSGSSRAEEAPPHDRSGYFVYPMEDVYSFDADKDGNLYAAAYNSDALKVYDPYGAEIDGKTLPTPYHTAIAVDGGDVFTLSANELYRNGDKLYSLPFERSAKDIRIVGENVYLLFTDVLADLSQAPMLDPLNGWNGEGLLRLHLPDLSVSEVTCEYPLLISANDNELWVYGIDENGAYIAPVRADEAGEHIPIENDISNSFLVVDPSGKYVFSGASESSTLTLRMTDPTNGQSNELMPNVAVFDAGGIKARGGYIYYLNRYARSENKNKVERICRSDYEKDNVPVKLLAADRFSYIPFGCGRTVVESRLSDEEFALAVLSQDRGFDACVLSSAQDFSRNFRDRGSFYALNDVPGVSEYVERLLPAPRGAAINEDGEIWALPLSMNVPCALYNTENCGAAGFSPNGLSLEELIAETGKLYKTDTSRRDICVSADAAITLLLRYELSGGADVLNAAEFSDKMNFIKTEMSCELFGLDVSIEANNSIYHNFGAGMLVMLAEVKQKQLDFSGGGDIRPAGLFDGKNPADCVFLCVNPSSDNLAATLEYVAALCGYLSAKTDDFMLDDPSLYSDSPYISELLEIYRDSEIFFRIPDEILSEPVKRYRGGSLSLTELTAEYDRKLSAYLNE